MRIPLLPCLSLTTMPGSSDPEDSGESDELVAVAGGSCVGAFFRRFGAVDEDESTEEAVALSPAAFFAPAIAA